MEREVHEFMQYYINSILSERDFQFVLQSYAVLQNEKTIKVRSNKGLFNLEIMDEEQVKLNFRFKKKDLDVLKNALKIPDVIEFKSGCRVQGLIALCILLKRLSYPNRLKDLEDMFGMCYSSISEIITWMIQFISDSHGHLLQDIGNISWLNQDKLNNYCSAISDSRNAPLTSCWGFIEGTPRRICRPQKNQQDYFSEHKRFHCVKYQSILAPDGLIKNLQGSFKGKRHDAGIFRESRIYEQLIRLHQFGSNYVIYRDPTYPISDVLISLFRGASVNIHQQMFNSKMSTVRQAVEWGFQKICTLFTFVDFHKNQKLLLQDVTGMYKVATLLTNCHTCLYGGVRHHNILI